MRILLLVLVLAVTTACVQTDTIPGSGWWTYRKDAGHSTLHTGTDIRLPLTLAWTREFTEGVLSTPGIPVFGLDRIYVALSVLAQNPGTSTTRLLALRLADGETEWSFTPPPPMRTATMIGPPVISNGRVYVAFLTQLPSGSSTVRVFALRTDGTIQWSREITTPDAELIGAMTAAKGLLLLCTSQGLERRLHALRQDDGGQAWSVNLGAASSQLVSGIHPVVFRHSRGRTLVLLSSYDDLRALDLEQQGQEVWRFPWPRKGSYSTPVAWRWSAHNDPIDILVSVGTGEYPQPEIVVDVHQITENGSLRRTRTVNLPHVLSGGGAYLAAIRAGVLGGPRAFVFGGTAVRALDGWTWVDPDRRDVAMTPALAPGIIFHDNTIRLRALDAASGAVLWEDAPIGTGFSSGWPLSGGTVIDQGRVVSAVGSRIRVFRPAP